MKKFLTQSKEMSHEYCCTVVKVGEVNPIEGSDFLGQVMIEGRTIVVRKDQVKEGDVLIYASNESQLATDFLFVNNLFEDKTMNSNPEVKGYFNKNGRVRMVKLRGVLSMGYLFGVDELKKYCPTFNEDITEYIGDDFDTVNGELFIKAYVPPVHEPTPRQSRDHKRNKKLVRFDRMIPGQFAFHYDTNQLQREINRLNPDDIVTISNKLHGTSAIFGNIKVRAPKFGGLYAKVFNYLPKFLQFTNEQYDVIYSSRTVIKNQYVNKEVTSGYYKVDVWGEYYEMLKDYIPQGMMIYGEIVGYITGANTMIQKGYDYRCNIGENKLMVYRITSETENGKFEWEVQEVRDWTEKFMKDHPELAHKLLPIDIMYHGTLKNLYPNIDTANHWHENVLEALKNDTEHFGMEMNEPNCRNKVPREGFVLRIDHDPIKEAFKLKCLKFLKKEADDIDNGTYDDIETSQRYE